MLLTGTGIPPSLPLPHSLPLSLPLQRARATWPSRSPNVTKRSWSREAVASWISIFLATPSNMLSQSHKPQHPLQLALAVCKQRPTLLHLEKGSFCLFLIDLCNNRHTNSYIIHLSMYLFTQEAFIDILLYSGTFWDAEIVATMNKRDKFPAHVQLIFYQGRWTTNKYISSGQSC